MLINNLGLFRVHGVSREFIFLAFVLAAFFCNTSCNTSGEKRIGENGKDLDIERYKIEILVGNKLSEDPSSTLPENFIKLLMPIIPSASSTVAFLPDGSSKIIGFGWKTIPDFSLYIQKPCTGTQVTAKTCTQDVITSTIRTKFAARTINLFASAPDYTDSIKVSGITSYINSIDHSNSKIYILSDADDANQLFTIDTLYRHCFNSMDTIRNRIENDIANNKLDFIVIYYPPTEKSETKQTEMALKPKVKKIVPEKKKMQRLEGNDSPIVLRPGLKRIPGKNEVVWSKSLSQNSDKVTISFIVKGKSIIDEEDVTNFTSYTYNPGTADAQGKKTTVELKLYKNGKLIPVSGSLILTDQIFNCSSN